MKSWAAGIALDVSGGKLYWAEDELWVSDGSGLGTTLVCDIAPGSAGSDPADMTPFGAEILFSADDGSGDLVVGTHGRSAFVLHTSQIKKIKEEMAK